MELLVIELKVHEFNIKTSLQICVNFVEIWRILIQCLAKLNVFSSKQNILYRIYKLSTEQWATICVSLSQ